MRLHREGFAVDPVFAGHVEVKLQQGEAAPAQGDGAALGPGQHNGAPVVHDALATGAVIEAQRLQAGFDEIGEVDGRLVAALAGTVARRQRGPVRRPPGAGIAPLCLLRACRAAKRKPACGSDRGCRGGRHEAAARERILVVGHDGLPLSRCGDASGRMSAGTMRDPPGRGPSGALLRGAAPCDTTAALRAGACSPGGAPHTFCARGAGEPE